MAGDGKAALCVRAQYHIKFLYLSFAIFFVFTLTCFAVAFFAVSQLRYEVSQKCSCPDGEMLFAVTVLPSESPVSPAGHGRRATATTHGINTIEQVRAELEVTVSEPAIQGLPNRRVRRGETTARSTSIEAYARLPITISLESIIEFCNSSANKCPAGPRGKDGAAGEKGREGVPGINGETGLRGRDGKAGIQGRGGEPGIQGPAGRPGEDCNCSSSAIQDEQVAMILTQTAQVASMITSMELPPGPQGPPGDTGQPGQAGPSGPLGPPGQKGAQGPIGPQGEQGPLGAKGDQGDIGPTGVRGDPGESGPPGLDGPQGPSGALGPPGPMGALGAPGPRGDTGDLGLPGEPGRRGKQGDTGAPGDKGEAGEVGVPGPIGMKGDTGSPGVNGSTGEHGKDGVNCTCIIQEKTTSTHTSLRDPNTAGILNTFPPASLRGTSESSGDNGEPASWEEEDLIRPQEPTGYDSSTGPIGPGVDKGTVDIPENGANGEHDEMRSEAPAVSEEIRGEKGAKGEPGSPGQSVKGDMGEPCNGKCYAQGRDGKKGSTGPVGSPGIRGLAGPPGMLGPQGDPGIPGTDGSVGPTGSIGPKGTPGAKGLAGSFGYPGDPGQKGSKGDIGPRGYSGEHGLAGLDGLPGRNGATGEKGDPGLDGAPGGPGPIGRGGPDGRSGEKGTQGKVGSAGPPGRDGSIGTKGDKGNKGDRGIASGMVELGSDGDRGKNPEKSVATTRGSDVLITECSLVSVGPPVDHQFGNTFWGSWMQDTASDAPYPEKIWITKHLFGDVVYEYVNLVELKAKRYARYYRMADFFAGTGHVVYGNALYFHSGGSAQIVRYDFGLDAVTARTIIPNAVYLQQSGIGYLYDSEYTYIDLAVDDNGLWAVYKTAEHRNNLVVSLLEPETLTVTKTIVSGHPQTSAGDAFIMCGVLYTTKSSMNLHSTVDFAGNLFTGEVLPDVDVPYKNQFMKTTMMSFNPRKQLIYAWDKGYMTTYNFTVTEP